MILREVITIILLGVTIYLLIVNLLVVPVVTERCIQETGRTCGEARNNGE